MEVGASDGAGDFWREVEAAAPPLSGALASSSAAGPAAAAEPAAPAEGAEEEVEVASESEASEAATEAYPGPEGFLEAVAAERTGHWVPGLAAAADPAAWAWYQARVVAPSPTREGLSEEEAAALWAHHPAAAGPASRALGSSGAAGPPASGALGSSGAAGPMPSGALGSNLGSGLWALSSGLWALGSELWALGFGL